MNIWQKKFQEIDILVAEHLLYPERVEILKDIRGICREMQTYESKVSWSPSREAEKE